jgi:hypothetical protein
MLHHTKIKKEFPISQNKRLSEDSVSNKETEGENRPKRVKLLERTTIIEEPKEIKPVHQTKEIKPVQQTKEIKPVQQAKEIKSERLNTPEITSTLK